MSWSPILNRLKENQIIRMKKDYNASSFIKSRSDINALYNLRIGSLSSFARANQTIKLNTIGIVKKGYDLKDGHYVVEYASSVNESDLSGNINLKSNLFKYTNGPTVNIFDKDLFDIAEVWVDDSDLAKSAL